MEPRISATLVLSTSRPIDLAVVSERTGLPSDRRAIAGQPRTWPNGMYQSPSDRSWWSYGIDHVRTVDPEGVIETMLDLIDSVGVEFRAVRRELDLDAHLSLHIWMDEGATPDGTLTAAVLERLVALDIDLDLDLYPAD